MGDYASISIDTAKELEMTPEVALKFGKLLGAPGIKILIGRDANPSSLMISDAITAGLLSVEADVWEAGVLPTPVLVEAASDYDYVISVGSPNSTGMFSIPHVYNGDGSGLSEEQKKAILRKFNDKSLKVSDYPNIGGLYDAGNIRDSYIEKMSKFFEVSDTPIIMDCGCGSTALVAPNVLANIGSTLVCINGHMDRNYRPRPPGVDESDLGIMTEIAEGDTGGIGISYNGDGTRLAIMDESGTYVTAEEMMALFLSYLKPDRIAIPINMSSLVDDAFFGRTEKLITDATAGEEREIFRTDGTLISAIQSIKNDGAEIGMTDDGLFIFSNHSLCPDAIYASELMAKISESNSIRSIVSSFPYYYTVKDTVHFSINREIMMKNLSENLKNFDCDRIYDINGWRIEMEYGWFSISFDNEDYETLNVIAESRDRTYAVVMADMAKNLVYKSI